MNADYAKRYQKAETVANNIHTTIVHFSSFVEAYSKTVELYERTKTFGKPYGLVVKGATGSGKTTVIEELKKEYKPVYLLEGDKYPVIFISVPGSPDGKSLYRAILSKMGVKASKQATESMLREQAVQLLIEAGTKLLVIDEVQHFVEKEAKKKASAIADCFKTLMNEARVSIAFFGLPYLTQLLDKNSQLKRRFSETCEVTGWDFEKADDLKEFCSAIKALLDKSDSNLKTDALEDNAIIYKIYYATDGRISYLVTLIAETIRLSILDKKKAITEVYFEKAFKAKIWHDAPDTRNPFHKKFKRGRLNIHGECFAEEVVL